ncbi:hypothetical protein [Hydrogenophaga sp.]|uniref:hypothetical protein n=1 Tax=Hydrogenophaga sp. TaxID=1904254 RepID=UPI003F6EFD10
MIVIGIDPGLSGACAVLDHNGLRAVFDLPIMPIPDVGHKALVKKKLDGRALRRLLLDTCAANEPVLAVVEAVGVMGGKNNSIQTQGSLLRTLGAVENTLECLNLVVVYAPPKVWKGFYGLTADKDAARHVAQALYPDAPLKRVKDHNRAESILIAHWHLRHAA